jgi:hypothetical protein
MAQQRYTAKSGRTYSSPQDIPITEEEKAQIEAYDAQLNAQTALNPPSPSDKPAATIRTVNPKTGQVQMITPEEYQARLGAVGSTGQLLSSPFTGAAKAAHGLYGMVTGQHGAEEEPSAYPRWKAFSEIVRGVGEALTPALYEMGGQVAMPALRGSFFPMAQAAKVVVPSMAAQKGTELVAEAVGAPPEVATALGDVAGLGAGAGTTRWALSAARQRGISQLPERQLVRYANEVYDLLPSVVKNAIADTPQEVQAALQKALPEIVAYYRKNPDFQLALEKGRPEDAKQVIEHFHDALDVAISDIMATLKSNIAPIASNKIPVVNPVEAVKADLLDKKTSSAIADRVLRKYNIVDENNRFIPRSFSEWENKITDLNTALRSIKQRANVQEISDLLGDDQEFRSIDRLVKTIREQLGDFMDKQGVEIGNEYRESRRLVAHLRDVRDALSDNFMFAGRQQVTPKGVAAGLTQSGYAASEAGRAAGGGTPGVAASVLAKTKLKQLLSENVNKALLDIIRKADAGDIGPSAPRPSAKPPKPVAELPEYEEPSGPPRDFGTIMEADIIGEGTAERQDPIRGLLLAKNPPRTAIITPPPGYSTLEPQYSGVIGEAQPMKNSSASGVKAYFTGEIFPGTEKPIQVQLGPKGSWMNMLPQQIVREQPAGVMSVKPTKAGDKTGGLQVVYTDPNTGVKSTVIFKTKALAEAFLNIVSKEFGK